MTFFRSLQFQFALGMTGVCALVLILISLFYMHQKEVQQQQQFSITLQTAKSNIQQLQKTAINYTQNAPRNFENYRRDLNLTYKAFSKDMAIIAQLHEQLDKLIQGYQVLPFQASNLLEVANEYKELCNLSLANYQKSIGDDPNEPRLEWAATALAQDLPEVINALDKLTLNVINTSNREVKLLQGFIVAASGILLLSLILGSVWFYLRIILRTQSIARACNEIARGDFGIQIEHQAKDELGMLSDSFNLMSSQTHMVSKLINDLQSAKNIEDALNIFWLASKPYLGINWAGLLEVNEGTHKAKLLADNSAINLVHSELDLKSNAFGSDLLKHVKTSKVLAIHDVNQYRLSNGNSRFLRDMHRTTLAKNLYVFPLQYNQHWHGAIMIAHPSAKLTDTQVDLMMNISGWMAQHFSRLMKDEASEEKRA